MQKILERKKTKNNRYRGRNKQQRKHAKWYAWI